MSAEEPNANQAMSPANVCAIVVAYYPDEQLLRESIQSALKQVNHVIVIDNSPGWTTLLPPNSNCWNDVCMVDEESEARRLIVVANPKNLGLPKAFNQGIAVARTLHASHVLFLDQDSVLAPSAVERLLSSERALSRRFNVGALQARNLEPVTLTQDDLLSDYLARRGRFNSMGVREQILLINSGTFMRTDILQDVGGYNEKYFVDGIDHEIALRLQVRGYRIFRVQDAIIRHKRGEIRIFKKFGLTFALRQEGVRRHFYISRDTLRTVRAYSRQMPTVALLLALSVFAHFVAILIGASDRRRALISFFAGIVEFIRGGSGEYDFGILGLRPPSRASRSV